MQATVGTPFTATLPDPGGVTSLGVRVETPITRAIQSYWRPAVLVNGVWAVITEPPVAAGEYLLVWRSNDPEPPDYETFIPLVVGAATSLPSEWPDVDPDDPLIRPTVDDVAALERTRTIADNTEEDVTFTEFTRPTAVEVGKTIDQAVPLVLMELPDRIDPKRYESLRYAIALYAATLIEGSYFKEQDEGTAGLWRTLYNSAILNLKSQVNSDVRELNLPTGLESWRPTPFLEGSRCG